MSFVVVRAGALATVQDRGRPGYAHLGIARSGALDLDALTLANRAVGNDDGAAVLETTLSGVGLRAVEPMVVAVAGAHCAVRVDGRPVAWGAPVLVRAGQVLDVGPAARGVRSYVAVRGGVDAAPVLGSRSRDVLGSVGPEPLRDGERYDVGAEPATDGGWPGPLAARDVPDEITLPLVLGPRADWFTAGARRALWAATYVVGSASNRVGLRLQGAPLERRGGAELPSEGMVLGAVQVPPDGQPVVFLADHPVTGGYPVIGVVTAEGVGAAAQAVPGSTARFVRAVGP
ncbi:biotin-dependent carboxylase uncharacterized domain-containing protein [Paraoerskovia marina]|uniref:Biotin-dependent carboxylase uncharacterized domain-containing protein n=1 Tax=Paraoerskovia marina TaxID=545619 RepID=A0A1H1RPK0_9CELL|nr:biotin-dependent carboxyltransferase family protein [Paraoerskovia marina]SDS37711.1 biotin-dependent carboxylase uncharacterized domain-containing protein [Paraoerskovia marina]